MDTRPEPPPEGRLIEAATALLDISIREAARRAGISYGRWRQIVKGYQNVSPGSYAPVRNAPARTIARMARAAGVTPARLASEGCRPDAAAILADLLAAEDEPTLPGIPAAAGPADEMARIGAEQFADQMFALAAGIREEIDDARRKGVPDSRIFTSPSEQDIWSGPGTRLTPEDQRVLAIAWLRAVRPARPEAGDADPPAALAGLAAWGAAHTTGLLACGDPFRRETVHRKELPETPAALSVIQETDTSGTRKGWLRCRLSGMGRTTSRMSSGSCRPG